MRVLLTHNRYRRPGGEERHLDLLERSLTEAGVEVRRFETDSDSLNGSLPRRLALAAGMTYRPSSGRAMASALGTWRPDVVHAHNLLPGLTPSVLHAAKQSGVPVVLTAHNYRLVCPAGTLMRKGVVHDDCVEGSSLACGLRNARGSWPESVAYGVAIALQRRLRLVERWVDRFVTPSAAVRDVLIRAGFDAPRIRVIPNGVHVGDWHQRPREFGLFAGRLSEEKGVRVLLDAARSVDVPLVVAGDGPLAEEVRARANGRLRFAGWLGPSELAALRQRAAFVVVPSIGPEVLPYSALEALADGTPVIGSDQGGLREVVPGDDGVGCLVPSGDQAALARAMQDWWTRAGDDGEFGRRAWEHARERFSIEAQTATLLALYEEVRAA